MRVHYRPQHWLGFLLLALQLPKEPVNPTAHISTVSSGFVLVRVRVRELFIHSQETHKKRYALCCKETSYFQWRVLEQDQLITRKIVPETSTAATVNVLLEISIAVHGVHTSFKEVM